LGTPDVPLATLSGKLEEQLPQWSWDETLERLLAESPQLAEARAGVERAQWVLKRQCAQRLPNVEVSTDVLHDNVSRDPTVSLAVGVPLPIFDRNQGNIRKAQAELAVAQEEVRRVELALRQQLAAVFAQYRSAQQQVEQYSANILPNAKESLQLVRSSYQNGETNYQSVLLAQRTFFQASLAYLDSLSQLRASAVSLEGLLLTGALQAGAPVAAPQSWAAGSRGGRFDDNVGMTPLMGAER
jgi:cobalt-zinc-cadmium efflux system outer membrane protein